MSTVSPLFSGEVLFRRWSDSSTQGVQVTFALADAAELEPLKAKAGKRFACVLVEIGDDEQPIQTSVKPRPADTRGPLCREACDYCADTQFQRWVYEDISPSGFEKTEQAAREWLLLACNVSSRKELDTDPLAGKMFVERIRIPFMRWQRSNRMVSA
jgi:hypothetical protein